MSARGAVWPCAGGRALRRGERPRRARARAGARARGARRTEQVDARRVGLLPQRLHPAAARVRVRVRAPEAAPRHGRLDALAEQLDDRGRAAARRARPLALERRADLVEPEDVGFGGRGRAEVGAQLAHLLARLRPAAAQRAAEQLVEVLRGRRRAGTREGEEGRVAREGWNRRCGAARGLQRCTARLLTASTRSEYCW